MIYTIAKKNCGPVGRYKTQGRLAAFLKRHGARDVTFHRDGREIVVRWPENVCEYKVGPDGTIEEQLAWDL